MLFNAGVILCTQGLSLNAVYAINGLILLLVAVAEAVSRYRLVRARASEDAGEPARVGGGTDG